MGMDVDRYRPGTFHGVGTTLFSSKQIIMKRPPNYKKLFYLAMFFIALGIVLSNNFDVNNSIGLVFIAVGGLFLMTSLKNKDKWDVKKE